MRGLLVFIRPVSSSLPPRHTHPVADKNVNAHCREVVVVVGCLLQTPAKTIIDSWASIGFCRYMTVVLCSTAERIILLIALIREMFILFYFFFTSA